MAEPFAFTQHLKELVAPALSPLGFKQKGAQFLRKSGDATQYIWFQRDRYNSLYASEGRPCRFWLNLNCGRDDGEYNSTGLRLINPSARREPLWWFVLTKEQRDNQWPLLSKAQKQDLLEVQDSRDWWYRTEEDLCLIFGRALEEILSKGLPYLDCVTGSLGELDFSARIKEATHRATDWYHTPDENVTAFPLKKPHLAAHQPPEPWYRRLFRK